MPGPSFTFPTLGTTAKNRATLLAVDDYSLPLTRNLCRYLSRPTVRQEPVLTPDRANRDAPDFLATHFYGTVLLDGGTYRMWYYSCGLGEEQGAISQGPVCYAESDDGITWKRPKLGQTEFRGSKDNNAIALPETLIEGVFVIKDDDDPDPGRRYKMVYNPMTDHPFRWSIRTAWSSDGINWTPGPAVPYQEFIEPSGFFKFNGMYYVNGQVRSRSEGGHPSGRQGWAAVSADFDRWLPEIGESFVLEEPADPQRRGFGNPYDQVHLGTAAVSYGNALVGLYCNWHNRETFGEISGDLGLVVSNDGIHFREPAKGHVYLAKEDSPVTPVAGKSYPTVLVQANGFVNAGDQTRIYHGRWRNAAYRHPNHPGFQGAKEAIDYWGEVALATLPRDRWGALGLFPDRNEGSLWTAPFVVPDQGCSIMLNADGAERMAVEIADERFNPLEELSGDRSGRVTEDGGLYCPVRWPGASTATVAGRTVRLRVHVKRGGKVDPRLYAIYLTV